MADPAALEQFVLERQVRLAEVRGMDYPTILKTLNSREYERLERESLPKKARRLIALISPETGTLPDGYSEEWLERFDERRHRLVHSSKVSLEDPSVGEEFNRVGSLAEKLTYCVRDRHQIAFDLDAFMSSNS